MLVGLANVNGIRLQALTILCNDDRMRAGVSQNAAQMSALAPFSMQYDKHDSPKRGWQAGQKSHDSTEAGATRCTNGNNPWSRAAH